MKLFAEYLSERYILQLMRDKSMDVLKIKDSREEKWVEVRGKRGYEIDGYDKKDKLHKVLDIVGKSANVSQLMNGKKVSINPNHPDAKKSLKAIKKIMSEK